ncbi:FHA domain-containing protein [Calditrichota bacterium LG25]
MKKRIGRGKDNDLMIPSDFAKVSTHHCVVELQSDGNYYLTDIGSRNGTTINGKLIPQNKPQRIGPTDEIILGNQYTLTWDQVLSLFKEKTRKRSSAPSSVSAPAHSVSLQDTNDYVYKYGGFWVRFGASIFDMLIVNLGVLFIGIFFALLANALADGPGGFRPGSGFTVFISFLMIIFAWLYFALQWSSRYQATVGMRLFQIFLVDNDLNPVTFGRATGRFFAQILSSLALIGHVMCGFHPEKRAFHDIISRTRVVRYERPQDFLQKDYFEDI